MTSPIVSDWFGEDFQKLHPLLQALHRHGGKLSGVVHIEVPKGLGGFVGRRLAEKLGVPTNGVEHHLEVDISHRNGYLLWERCFDGKQRMTSLFRPIGNKSDGYWLEETGPISMALTVDCPDGGWHWRCLVIRIYKMRLPMWFFPQSKAYKLIEDGKYRFYVGFSLPIIGPVLSYSGKLTHSLAN